VLCWGDSALPSACTAGTLSEKGGDRLNRLICPRYNDLEAETGISRRV
jgi:hypothetical protein